MHRIEVWTASVVVRAQIWLSEIQLALLSDNSDLAVLDSLNVTEQLILSDSSRTSNLDAL
jgi:hypothetical protein